MCSLVGCKVGKRDESDVDWAEDDGPYLTTDQLQIHTHLVPEVLQIPLPFTLNVQDIFEPLNRLIAVYSVYYPQYPALYSFSIIHIHNST